MIQHRTETAKSALLVKQRDWAHEQERLAFGYNQHANEEYLYIAYGGLNSILNRELRLQAAKIILGEFSELIDSETLQSYQLTNESSPYANKCQRV